MHGLVVEKMFVVAFT